MVAVVLSLVVACTAGHPRSAATAHAPATPPTTSATAHGFRLVAWGNGMPPSTVPAGYSAYIRGASQLTVLLGGSGSCPWLPDAIKMPSDTRVLVHIQLRRSTFCSSDFISQYFVVQLPRAVAESGKLTLALRYGQPLNRTHLFRVRRV